MDSKVDTTKDLSDIENQNGPKLEVSVVATNQLVSDRIDSDKNSITTSEVDSFLNLVFMEVITSYI